MTDVTGGRREIRKAQTRADVRAVAQRLFNERGFDEVTIADIAAAADVAVQTVFNHFETKEALFFDDRTPWVEGGAAAITFRTPGTDPVSELRRYLESDLFRVLDRESRPENLGYVVTLENSPGLQSRERTLVEEAGTRVSTVLSTAILAGEWDAAPAADPATAHILSQLVADLFMVAGRTLVLENRRLVLHPELDSAQQVSVARTAPVTLGAVEQCVRALAAALLGEPG